MSQTPISFGRLLAGFILISLGAGYLLQTMGYLPYPIIHYLKEFFWPVIDLLIGIWFLGRTYLYSWRLKARRFSRTNFLIGISFLLVSGALTLDRLGYWHFSVHELIAYLWPVLIILLGISLLFRPNYGQWVEGKWGWNYWGNWEDYEDQDEWKDWKNRNGWNDWHHANSQKTGHITKDHHADNSSHAEDHSDNSGQYGEHSGSSQHEEHFDSGQHERESASSDQAKKQYQMNDYDFMKEEFKQHRREWKRHHKEWKRRMKEEWRHSKKDYVSNLNWVSLQNSSYGIGDLSVGHSEGWVFEDLAYRHLFGDVRMDLSHAIFQKDTNHLSIESWAGDIRLVVPMNLAVRVEAEVLAGSIRLFSSRVDGIKRAAVYVSPNYDEAERKLHITISLKAGDIRVIRS